MNRLLFLFLLLVPSLMAQPAPFLRNSWTTNAAGTPVRGQDNLSVTNLDSGTNWLFHSVRPQTIARLIDITNVVTAIGGGTNYWTNDPPGYLRPSNPTNSIWTGTNQTALYGWGDIAAGLAFTFGPYEGFYSLVAADVTAPSVNDYLESYVIAFNPIDSKQAYQHTTVVAGTNSGKTSVLELSSQGGTDGSANIQFSANNDPALISQKSSKLNFSFTHGPTGAVANIDASGLTTSALETWSMNRIATKPFLICSTNGSNVFLISNDGNIEFLRKVSYSWPTSQGAAQSVLTNNGAGVLGWGTAASGGGNFNINQFEASATHTNIKSAALLTNIVSRNITNAGVSVTMASGVELRWPGFTLLENVPSGAQLILNGQFNVIGAVDFDSTLLVNGSGQFDTNTTVLGTNIVNWGQYPLLTASRALVLNANNGVAVASGTPDGTKFLRDDNTYATPPGGLVTPGGNEANLQVKMGSDFVGSTNTFYDVTNSTLAIGTNLAFSKVHVRQTGTNAIARFDSGILTDVIRIATNHVSIMDGSSGNPSIRFNGDDSTGWYQNAGAQWTFQSIGTSIISLISSVARMSIPIGFSPTDSETGADVSVFRRSLGLVGIGIGSASGFGNFSASNGHFMGELVATNSFIAQTNATILGTNDARYLKLSGGVPGSSILRTDSNTNVVAATIGTGLSFDGTTLTATASGGGATTNANQFGVAAELTIKSGALLTNVLFYPSNLTGPATIHLPTTAQMTNLTEWRGTNGAVGLAISSNGLAMVQERLDLANAVAFRTNNIDFRLNTYQAFTASLKTNLVLQLTNTYEGVTTRIDAYGAGRLGGGATNAWQLLCTVASGVNIYWPPGTTNGNYDVLVNSNQVVSFTFMGGLGSTNILASYRVLEGIGAN